MEIVRCCGHVLYITTNVVGFTVNITTLDSTSCQYCGVNPTPMISAGRLIDDRRSAKLADDDYESGFKQTSLIEVL